MKSSAMRELLEQHPSALTDGCLVVVTRHGLRIRQRGDAERGRA